MNKGVNIKGMYGIPKISTLSKSSHNNEILSQSEFSTDLPHPSGPPLNSAWTTLFEL